MPFKNRMYTIHNIHRDSSRRFLYDDEGRLAATVVLWGDPEHGNALMDAMVAGANRLGSWERDAADALARREHANGPPSGDRTADDLAPTASLTHSPPAPEADALARADDDGMPNGGLP